MPNPGPPSDSILEQEQVQITDYSNMNWNWIDWDPLIKEYFSAADTSDRDNIGAISYDELAYVSFRLYSRNIFICV